MNKRLFLGFVFFFVFVFVFNGNSVVINNCQGLSPNTDYELNSNIITALNTDCFNLDNNVTFDCRSFSIIGNNTANAFSSSTSGQPLNLNSIIRNCNIENFQRAISLDQSGGVLIENSIIKNMTETGIYFRKKSYNNEIYNVTFENNNLDISFSGLGGGTEPANNTIYMSKFKNRSGISMDYNILLQDNFFYKILYGERIGNFWSPINKSSCLNSTQYGYYHVCDNPGNYTINSTNNVFDPAPLIDYSNKIYSCMEITFPGSYVLNNSVNTSLSCFEINVNNVGLNCLNNNIISLTGLGVGISVLGNNSYVNNCNIYNFNISYLTDNNFNGSFLNSNIINSSLGVKNLKAENSYYDNLNFYNTSNGIYIDFFSKNTTILFSSFLNISNVAIDFGQETFVSGNHFKDENYLINNNWILFQTFFNFTVPSIGNLNIGNFWSNLNYTNCDNSILVGFFEVCTDPGNYTVNGANNIYDYRPLIDNPFNLLTCQNITVPGNYKLLRNVNSVDSCFEIYSDDVSLDCLNNNIIGSLQADSYGILLNNVSNVSINNCHVFDYDINYNFDYASKSSINNSFSYNGISLGLQFFESNDNIVQNFLINSSISSAAIVNSSNNVFENIDVKFSSFGMIFADKKTYNNIVGFSNFTNVSSKAIYDFEGLGNIFYLNYFTGKSSIVSNKNDEFNYTLPGGLTIGNYWDDLNCQSSIPYQGYYFCEDPFFYNVNGSDVLDFAPLTRGLILPDRNFSLRLYENSLLDFFVFQTRKNYTFRDDYKKEDILNHLVLTYNGTQYNVYLNGKLIRVVNTTSPDFLKYDKVIIGGKENDFKGLVDEVKIYSRPLSHDEVEYNFYNYQSNSKGCCNYLTLINPNLMGYNTTSYNKSVSYSTNVFYDYYKRGEFYNLSLYEVTNITSSQTNESYYNFLVDACMINAYTIESFGQLSKILSLRNIGEYNFSCSNLVSKGIY